MNKQDHYPPTPAACRGSALKEDLLATRGQNRKADKQEEEKKPESNVDSMGCLLRARSVLQG